MVWCAKRATDNALVPPKSSKGKGREKGLLPDIARTDEGDQLVKDIMGDFLGNLSRGSIDTNVFGREVSSGRIKLSGRYEADGSRARVVWEYHFGRIRRMYRIETPNGGKKQSLGGMCNRLHCLSPRTDNPVLQV
jgi:hypothetical protein